MTPGHAGHHSAAVRAARLLQHKKHRLERRCFVIEGPVMLQAAQAAGAPLEQIFALDEIADGLATSSAATPVTRVDERTLASLAQTKTPQGVVAVVGFVDRHLSDLGSLLPKDGSALALVLPNLADPGNAGTLMRSAEAFGVQVACFGPDAVDPYNDKVVRASMGSLFRLPFVRYTRWAELVGELRSAGMRIVAADAGADDVRTVTLPQRVALVVGQERHGLDGIPAGDLDARIGVPQRRGVESLNAGVAGSLLVYECARANGLLGGERT